MGNKESDYSTDPLKNESEGTETGKGKNDFNAGGNASDYDGGHPKDVYPESEGRISSDEERPNQKEKSDKKSLDENEFNAGGNDSDYDGGHPQDVSPKSEGRIDSNNDNPGK
ncbi:hypothetical protein [Planococcus salinus]|uniref:Uncharacterized protein n=1 Tax=Planococcus salinus TaxID=1848460 RepID=A0A3M8P9J1_9BACL|nr:hypothetical protein [Planococcus salinus]RNF40282.1 hypothetical protein EEX84_06525 [Planococcus salinus]